MYFVEVEFCSWGKHLCKLEMAPETNVLGSVWVEMDIESE